MNEKQVWINFFRLVLVIIVVSALFLMPPIKQLSWIDIAPGKAYALSNNITASDVYAAWLFNDNVTDSIGNNDLITDNSPTYSATGHKEGTKLIYFSASSNQSCHIDDADLDAGFPGKDGVAEQDFTITAWVLINSAGYHDIIGKYDQTNDERSWRLYLNNNKLEFTVGHTNGTDNTTIQFGTAIQNGRYYHVACSYNATDNYMKMRVWNDNTHALLGSNKTGTAGADMSSSNATIWFGSTNQIDEGTDQTMQGSLDEVLVFNSFLSDDDIDLVRSGIYQRSFEPTIDTVYDKYAIRLPLQRNSFYAENLHWVFYAKDDYFYYSTSSDNSTWATPTQVAGIGFTDYAACYSISFNGTHVAYIRNSTHTAGDYKGVYFRVGIPQSNGTISWLAAEQTVYSTSIVANDFSLALDSSGYPWIASSNATTNVNVVTSTTNDGTWSTNSSYPLLLENNQTGNANGLLVPQTNRKMICFLYNTLSTANVVRARSFDGSTWGASEEISAEILSNASNGGSYGQIGAVSFGDTIHLVLVEASTGNIQYHSGSEGSWSSNTTLYTGNSTTVSPVIAKHSTDQLCVFWTDQDSHIYYDHFNGTSWDGVVDWIDATGYLVLPDTFPNNQCFEESDSNIIGLSYMMDPGSDQTLYGIEYAPINTTDLGWDAGPGIVTPTVTTQNATNIEETTATGNGNITATGGENCTQRGIGYSISSGWPYSSNTTSFGDFSTGNFTGSLASLTPGELYYTSSFAGNSAGYGHGDEVTFLTKPNGVTGFHDTSTTNTSVSLSWYNGTGMDYVEIRYQENSYVSDNTTGTLGYWGSGASTTISGLSENTTYYFSIYTHATEGGLWNTADTVGQDTATATNPASGSTTMSDSFAGLLPIIRISGLIVFITMLIVGILGISPAIYRGIKVGHKNG